MITEKLSHAHGDCWPDAMVVASALEVVVLALFACTVAMAAATVAARLFQQTRSEGHP